ncbi:hypothetical protein [Brevundimonas phage AA]|uniref:Uncharacterized protein n=1 Tax=Brevundimonas phage AA TaxID=2880937 RepID=A0AAN0KEL6_9CAUD|nr:hypothetical protein [Brevundimonas phage BC]UCR90853.1 hypothetical protein [Brevundimonas phage AA]
MSRSPSNFAKPTSLAQIDQNIKWIAATGKKLDAILHATAVAIIVHAKEHGDCSRAKTMLDAMPKSGRAKALAAWFETFSAIRFNGDGEVGLLADKEKRIWLVEEAQATPFWELNPEKDVVVFDLDKALAALLKKAHDQEQKGILVPDAKLKARLAQVKSLVATAK